MDPNLFFPKRGGGQRKSKQICDDCTVRVECRDYAERTNTRYGIWGGEVLKRWGDSTEVDDDEPLDFVISDNDLGVPAFPLVTAGRDFPAFPASTNLQVEVHAETCDLDEDCSCHVATLQSMATVPNCPEQSRNGGTVEIITVRSRDDLPLCPPD